MKRYRRNPTEVQPQTLPGKPSAAAKSAPSSIARYLGSRSKAHSTRQILAAVLGTEYLIESLMAEGMDWPEREWMQGLLYERAQSLMSDPYQHKGFRSNVVGPPGHQPDRFMGSQSYAEWIPRIYINLSDALDNAVPAIVRKEYDQSWNIPFFRRSHLLTLARVPQFWALNLNFLCARVVTMMPDSSAAPAASSLLTDIAKMLVLVNPNARAALLYGDKQQGRNEKEALAHASNLLIQAIRPAFETG